MLFVILKLNVKKMNNTLDPYVPFLAKFPSILLLSKVTLPLFSHGRI